MKKLMYIFLVLSVLTGCKEKKNAGAMKGMPTPAISVAKPIVKDITLTKDYPGYLTTEKTVNLVARVNGTLQSVSYTPGGRVKKGQLLFVIEPALYNDKVAQAEAELKTAQAQLEYARNNYSRMKEAVKSDAVSKIQVLQSESSVKEGAETYPATLDYLSPNVDLNTGTLMVRANFDNPQGVLKSGLYVSITLPYGEADHAVLVKEASIGTDQLGKFLYAVNDSDIVRYRHIEVGQLINDTLRQVLGGLSPQERYVTEALMKVRDGMKIKPIP